MSTARTTTNISSKCFGYRRDTPSATAAARGPSVSFEGSLPDPDVDVLWRRWIPGQAAAVFIKRSRRWGGGGISLTGNHWACLPIRGGASAPRDPRAHARGASRQRFEEAPVSGAYEGQQIVGMDLHRRRSVLVRMTETGQHLETVRISNDPEYLRAVMARAGEAPDVVLEATYGWVRREGA